MTSSNHMHLHPVVLEGTSVRLEPLTVAHIPELTEVGLDPELWRWTPTIVRTPDDMRAYVELALNAQKDQSALPFVIIERSSGRAIGSTRFGNIDMSHRRVEIGWTWIASPWQRSRVNTEMKFLMLNHAFEVLGCRRVEFKTDSLNDQSRRAILRIGAQEEGIFRNHMMTYSGRVRHTVYYSIINSEWQQVKARLQAMLLGTAQQ